MRTAARIRVFPIIITVLILAAAALLVMRWLSPEEVDPHEGQVYINDGFGMVWMTPLEGVDVNTVTAEQLVSFAGQPAYIGEEFTTLRGVDVSEHQHEIDWKQVAASGVDFAMIRAGYRGYSAGGLFEDPFFRPNIEGALENGLRVGVYMFSQAVSVSEAMEEADYVLDLIRDYDVTMPVVFDWEKIEDVAEARTNDLDPVTLNDCAVAFCEKIRLAGYEPAVYFNRYLGYYRYDLSRLTDFTFWVSVPGSFPDFYYASELWQYSFDSTVPGIGTPCDMNMLFIPVPVPAEEEEP